MKQQNKHGALSEVELDYRSVLGTCCIDGRGAVVARRSGWRSRDIDLTPSH